MRSSSLFSDAWQSEAVSIIHHKLVVSTKTKSSRHDCFPEVPPDGLCLATPEDTVQEITSIEQVTYNLETEMMMMTRSLGTGGW